MPDADLPEPAARAAERRTLLIISDTHGREGLLTLPPADILVHCGDLTETGSVQEVARALGWLGAQPGFGAKVAIAGNHDLLFEQLGGLARSLAAEQGLIYLEGRHATVMDVVFYGDPHTQVFFDWAFMRSGEQLRRLWAPLERGWCDVLVTHGPPLGVLDRTNRGDVTGDPWLGEAVERAQPALHVFGHIHEAHGQLRRGEVLHLNAAVCAADYRPTQPGWLVTLERPCPEVPGTPGGWQVVSAQKVPLTQKAG